MTPKQENYARDREALVEEVATVVSDPRALAALGEVPRHLFVPPELLPQAYLNRALSIGYGQTISQPLIVAMMTAALEPHSDDRILEIGTGSGYQAAVLSGLVAEIYTIELVESLGKKTAALLESLGYTNIHCRIGDGSHGWPERAPFDGIIVTAAPDHVPQELIGQLKEGGRLVIPIGSDNQRLKLFIKQDGELKEQDLGSVRFVPMLGDSYHH